MSIEAMRNAVEAMDKHDYEMADHILCQAIAEAEKQEPFGFAALDEVTEQFNSVNCGTVYRLPAEGRSPLYTHPQPKREPLTDAEHEALMRGRSTLDYGRAVEAAHGIKGKT